MAEAETVTCREFVELVTDYLEGKLPAEGVRLMEEHLDLCDPCRVYLEQIEVTIEALPDAAADEPVPDETRATLLTMFRAWKGERAEQ